MAFHDVAQKITETPLQAAEWYVQEYKPPVGSRIGVLRPDNSWTDFRLTSDGLYPFRGRS